MQNINSSIAKLLAGNIDLLIVNTGPGRGAVTNLKDEITGLSVIEVRVGAKLDDVLTLLHLSNGCPILLDLEVHAATPEFREMMIKIINERKLPATAYKTSETDFTGKLIIKTFEPLVGFGDVAKKEVVTW